MRTLPVFLFLATTTFALEIDSKDDPSSRTPDVPCHIRAWVRAPNLVPGQVVQGQVKVQLDGPCDDVASYNLGLRFAERAWVKTRRANATLPVKPAEDPFLRHKQSQNIYDDVNVRFWPFAFTGNQSALDQYESDLKNPALWLVREEERIAFEVKYELSDDMQKPGRDIVKSFAILVPSTNFPPASDWMFSGSSYAEINAADAEHIYKYFVDVMFSNGTHREIEAGYTSFDAATATEIDHRPVSVNVTATPNRKNKGMAEGGVARDEFTLEVTFPQGKHFEEGSINNITIRSHQFGPGSQRPLAIGDVHLSTRQKSHWAAKHAADDQAAEELLNLGTISMRELHPKLENLFDSSHRLEIDLPNFSQDIAVENGKLFSTEPVTTQFAVPKDVFPPFEMYYQTMEVELSIRMSVRNISEKASEPDAELDDKEYDWTPTLREETSWRDTEPVRATMPISIYRKQEPHATLKSSPVHYLSPEARTPVFVDPASLPRLLKMTVEEQDNLAPRCQAKIVSKADGDVVKARYHTRGGSRPPQAHYYVGNTWLRKVPARGGDEAAQQDEVLIVQA